MSILARSPSAAWMARSRSLACRMPMMFSGVPRHSGTRVTGAASTALTTLLRRIVGVDGDHLGAVDHHVGDREVAQVEQRRRTCRGRASRRRPPDAADRPRRAVPRARTGSAGLAEPCMRADEPASSAPAPRSRSAPARAARTDPLRSAAPTAARCGPASLIATVFGSTSANTTTSTVMTTVA